MNDILCFFQEFLFYEACNATGVVLYHIMKEFNFVEGRRLGGFYSEEEVLDGLFDEAFVIDQGSVLDSSEVINSDDGCFY
jgi:hypothetical protein